MHYLLSFINVGSFLTPLYTVYGLLKKMINKTHLGVWPVARGRLYIIQRATGWCVALTGCPELNLSAPLIGYEIILH